MALLEATVVVAFYFVAVDIVVVVVNVAVSYIAIGKLGSEAI